MTSSATDSHLEDGVTHAPGRGARLASLAFWFVIAALLALAGTPILMTRRLENLRAVTDASVGKAGHLVPSLSLLFTQEATEQNNWRLTRDSAALARYRGFLVEEQAKLDTLQKLAPRIDSIALPPRVAELRRLVDRWHAVLEAPTDTRFEAPAVVALADSLRTATDRLEAAIHNAMERDVAEGERLVKRQRRFSMALGLLGVLAAAMVAWFARRDRARTLALARAAAEEARLRAESEQRREDLERISESKARLMRGFSHDVKNPLGASDGYLQLLEDGVADPATPRQQAFVARARRSLAAALNLIEDLLEIARAETGNIEVARVPTDVREVVREAAEAYRAQAEARGLTLTVDLPERLPPVESDPARVRQVLGNLISNAVKYTPAGGVSVRAGVRADGRAGGGRSLAVEVADTGLGIPREKQRLLFQEFVRFEPGAARGTGIGLAISHRIVQALGGDITLESEPGKGSTFVLWLPLEARARGDAREDAMARPAG